MSSDRIRVVLKDNVEESELMTLADRHKWFNVNRIAADGEQPQEYVYRTRDKATHLHWIEDSRIGVNYILVKGKDAVPIAAILGDELDNYSSETILKMARDPNIVGDERRGTLYHLALDKMEHGFDQETFDIFKRAMADKDPIVRGAAVTGSIYLGWKQLAEPMKALATENEPDESIRKDAALLSGRLEKLK